MGGGGGRRRHAKATSRHAHTTQRHRDTETQRHRDTETLAQRHRDTGSQSLALLACTDSERESFMPTQRASHTAPTPTTCTMRGFTVTAALHHRSLPHL
eukprot:3611009-Rhodomonas_salina.1